MIFTNAPSDHYFSYSQRIGEIFDVASRSRWHARASLLSLRVWIFPAVELSQVSVFYDSHGRAVGYFTWAYLSDQARERLLTDPHCLFDRHDWSSGEHFWTMDFAAVDGSLRAIAGYIRKVVLPNVGALNYLVRRSDGSIRRFRTVHLGAKATAFGKSCDS